MYDASSSSLVLLTRGFSAISSPRVFSQFADPRFRGSAFAGSRIFTRFRGSAFAGSRIFSRSADFSAVSWGCVLEVADLFAPTDFSVVSWGYVRGVADFSRPQVFLRSVDFSRFRVGVFAGVADFSGYVGFYAVRVGAFAWFFSRVRGRQRLTYA